MQRPNISSPLGLGLDTDDIECSLNARSTVYDTHRWKTYLLTYVPNVHSNQPAHPFRVFVVCMMKGGHPWLSKTTVRILLRLRIHARKYIGRPTKTQISLRTPPPPHHHTPRRSDRSLRCPHKKNTHTQKKNLYILGYPKVKFLICWKCKK